MFDPSFYMNPDKLVEEYAALVKSVAARYSSPHLSREDLIQEGMIGLLEANKRFDPQRGTQFSTYAHYWISKRVLSAVGIEAEHSVDPSSMKDIADPKTQDQQDPSRGIRLPADMPELEARIILLSYEQGYTIAKIAEETGLSREKVKQLRAKALRRIRARGV